MKVYLLVLHLLIIVNGRPIFVPCPELTSSGFLYSLTPDCQLITAPSDKAEQFQQVNKAVLSTGPCEVSPSSGLQHPIIMVSTLEMLEKADLPNLHILYHSPKEQNRRIVRVPTSAWSPNEINKTPLDSIGNSIDFPEGMIKKYDTCTMLENNVIRCFLMGVEDTSEVTLVWNDFLVGEKNGTISLKDHKIFLPATSLATNVPLAAFTKENGEVELLVTHLMKWLWRVIGTGERPNIFSQIRVPTKVTPASLSHFALPLIASPMGISSAVCDRKTAAPPDCAHFFTDMGSYSQCLMRTSFKMLVGFIPIKRGGEQRSVRRALKKEKRQYEPTTIRFEDYGDDEAHGNNTVKMAPELPVIIHTDVKVLQSQPPKTFAIVIIIIIFGVMLVLILIFLLCLLLNYRQKQEKELVKEKIHKEIEHCIPMRNAATKSDVERLMQAVNEAKKMSEKAAQHLQKIPPHETGLNECVIAQKKLEQAKLENTPSQKDSSKRLKTIDDNNNDNVVKEKENLRKIKVRVTLKEESESTSRTAEQSTTPDGTMVTPHPSTWTSIMAQTSEQISSIQNDSSEFQTEYLSQRNVRQIDHIRVRRSH